jgi:hypothetical protein
MSCESLLQKRVLVSKTDKHTTYISRYKFLPLYCCRAAKFMRRESKDIAPRRKGIYGGLTVMVRRALHLSHGSIGPVLFSLSLGTHLWAVQLCRLLGLRRRRRRVSFVPFLSHARASAFLGVWRHKGEITRCRATSDSQFSI